MEVFKKLVLRLSMLLAKSLHLSDWLKNNDNVSTFNVSTFDSRQLSYNQIIYFNALILANMFIRASILVYY